MANAHISAKVMSKALELSLKESDLMDIFNNGSHIKLSSGADAMVKKYENYGYQIGVVYSIDAQTGGYVITGVWKNKY